MTYIATFLNHYGALLLKKRLGDSCKVRAVPRSLSSSCGTCASIEGLDETAILEACDRELLEGLYVQEGKGYRKIHGSDNS